MPDLSDAGDPGKLDLAVIFVSASRGGAESDLDTAASKPCTAFDMLGARRLRSQIQFWWQPRRVQRCSVPANGTRSQGRCAGHSPREWSISPPGKPASRSAYSLPMLWRVRPVRPAGSLKIGFSALSNLGDRHESASKCTLNWDCPPAGASKTPASTPSGQLCHAQGHA